MTTLFILDAHFRSYAGHNAMYNGEVRAACLRHGIRCHIFGGSRSVGMGAQAMTPALSSSSEFPFASVASWLGPLGVLWKVLYCNLRRLVELGLHVFPLIPGECTVLIMDMSPVTLFGDCWFWGLMRLLGRRATIFVVLHDRPGKWFYPASWFASKCLLGQKLVLGCQPESLLTVKTVISPVREVVHLPTPQVHRLMTALRPACRSTRAGNKVVLSCLGLTSHAKGTDTMLRAVGSVLRRSITHQLQFVIQVDRQELARFAEPATCALAASLSRHPQVRFVESGVNNDEYAAMILESDCIVLPYRGRFYRYIQSGVFLEAVAAEKAVIVPRDTAMGRDCADYGLGLTFLSEDAEGLADTMTEMSMTIDKWLMAVKSNRDPLLSKHSIDRYVETLLYYPPKASRDATCAVTKLEHEA